MTPERSTGQPRGRLAALACAVLLLPLLLVQLVPSDTVEEYVFRALPSEEMGRSASGQLSYYRVDVLEGAAPATSVVVALDRNYSRGYTPDSVSSGSPCWFQGSLMTREVFYGEQYLFFGLPQVYVRQVRTGVLWPDQWTGMRVLYLSPLETLAAPLQLPFLLRSDSFTWRLLAVLLVRLAMLGVLIALAVKKRLGGVRLPIALLLFAMASMLVTMPVLGDLY